MSRTRKLVQRDGIVPGFYPLIFAATMKEFISKILPATVVGKCEPIVFSHIAQSHRDSPPSLPHPAHLGLLACHEQWLITSLSPGGGVGQSLKNTWLCSSHAYIFMQNQDLLLHVLLKKCEKGLTYRGTYNLHGLEHSVCLCNVLSSPLSYQCILWHCFNGCLVNPLHMLT